MTQSFDDAWKENRHVWESTKNLAKAMYLAGAQSKQAEIDELRSKMKAINEYQEIIFHELQLISPNFELIFNKLEDIDDLSKGTTNEQ